MLYHIQISYTCLPTVTIQLEAIFVATVTAVDCIQRSVALSGM